MDTNTVSRTVGTASEWCRRHTLAAIIFIIISLLSSVLTLWLIYTTKYRKQWSSMQTEWKSSIKQTTRHSCGFWEESISKTRYSVLGGERTQDLLSHRKQLTPKPSKESGQLHAHVHILHKHIHVVVNKCYANYQLTKHLQGIIQAPFIWPPLPRKHSWRDCFAYGTCNKTDSDDLAFPHESQIPKGL